jgi:hypothetical protein
LVRTAGLEPAQGFPQGILSLFSPVFPNHCGSGRNGLHGSNPLFYCDIH